MARGWESKSVEDQIDAQMDAANRRKSKSLPSQCTARDIERESLMLQRKRVLALIEQGGNSRYIEQQRKALAYLDDKLRHQE